MFSRSILAISAYVSLVSAAALDVFVPPITSPSASTKWTAGAVETVTWDTSNAPAQISNPSGIVVLEKGGLPVATLKDGFPITDGSVDVTVPANLTTGTDYTIILFGDSGNVSPQFEIDSA
ncbi:hypothetical protein PENSPDRAFT_758577 [Peniophora sp. CONT]|nr:hypothetical protein PENSPDRAFT_758577 [Peniophora sp. CONT]